MNRSTTPDPTRLDDSALAELRAIGEVAERLSYLLDGGDVLYHASGADGEEGRDARIGLGEVLRRGRADAQALASRLALLTQDAR